DLMAGMTHQGHLSHAVDYFSLTNLKGAFISISIGVVVYLGMIRPLLMRKTRDGTVYINAWPAGLDLEDRVYRPVIYAILNFGSRLTLIANPDFLEGRIYRPTIAFLTRVGSWAVVPFREEIIEGRFFVPLGRALSQVGFAVTRVLSSVMDGIAAVLVRTVLHTRRKKVPAQCVANEPTDVANDLNPAAGGSPRKHHLAGFVAGLMDGAVDARRRLTHTMSYALLMFGLGLCATLIYLIVIKG
ncbi:MAG: hypothetical protein IJ088_16845, partial [Clostridia bacterium]|nr:hypothetical protein [Clostridia bacterium]